MLCVQTVKDLLDVWKYILDISFILSSYASVSLRITPTCAAYWQFVSKGCHSSFALNVSDVRRTW